MIKLIDILQEIQIKDKYLTYIKNNQELLKVLNGPLHNKILDELLDNHTKWTEGQYGKILRKEFHDNFWEVFEQDPSKPLHIRDNNDNGIYLSTLPLKDYIPHEKQHINLGGKDLYIIFI